MNLGRRVFAPKDINGLHLVSDLRKFVLLYNALKGVSHPPIILSEASIGGRVQIVQGNYLLAALEARGQTEIPVISSPAKISLGIEKVIVGCCTFRRALYSAIDGAHSRFIQTNGAIHIFEREGDLVRHEITGPGKAYLMEYIPMDISSRLSS